MLAWLSRLPAPILYVVSVAIEKSFALVTIPLMALYLTPESYGHFDVAVALSEVVIMLVGLGLTDQLIRFASTARSSEGERVVAGEVMACAIVLAGLGCLLALSGSSLLKALLSLEVGLPALQVMLAGACLNNLIVLPMAWLRLQDDAQAYLRVVVARTFFQVAGIATALTLGYGADGVLISNGAILTSFSLYLTWQQSKLTPFRLSIHRFAQLGSYGAPLVGAMLAMFLLGSANRLFLAQWVNPEIVGQFGLASRLALATVLLLYPLELWWLPKRIAVLTQPGGLTRSADVWGIGVAVLLFSAVGVALVAPMFINAFLPPEFFGAIALLPLLVATQCLHALSGITEVGSYARETGYRVLLIDFSGAVVAVLGFLLLIPPYGPYGAIVAVVIGHLIRIGGYVLDGKTLAPIRYRWLSLVCCSLVVALLIGYAPPAGEYLARFLWTGFATFLLLVVVFVTGLVRIEGLGGLWSVAEKDELDSDSLASRLSS